MSFPMGPLSCIPGRWTDHDAGGVTWIVGCIEEGDQGEQREKNETTVDIEAITKNETGQKGHRNSGGGGPGPGIQVCRSGVGFIYINRRQDRCVTDAFQKRTETRTSQTSRRAEQTHWKHASLVMW